MPVADRLTRFLSVLCLLVLGLLLTGCQSGGPAGQAGDRPVYSPATVDEFVAAIGPNRIIELDPEVAYRLDQAKRTVSDFYTWGNPLRDQHEFIVRNCPKLTIRSAGEGLAHVATKHRYAYVLAFDNCDELALFGLKLGHDPDPGYCEGGVVSLQTCKDAVIDHCVLYGCGTEGLQLIGVRGLTFKQSIIEDCTYGMLSARECRDLHFVGSTFRANREYYGFAFDNTTGVRFKDCEVFDNNLTSKNSSLFLTNLNTDADAIQFIGGRIENNIAGRLVFPVNMLKVEATAIKDNQYARLPKPKVDRVKPH